MEPNTLIVDGGIRKPLLLDDECRVRMLNQIVDTVQRIALQVEDFNFRSALTYADYSHRLELFLREKGFKKPVASAVGIKSRPLLLDDECRRWMLNQMVDALKSIALQLEERIFHSALNFNDYSHKISSEFFLWEKNSIVPSNSSEPAMPLDKELKKNKEEKRMEEAKKQREEAKKHREEVKKRREVAKMKRWKVAEKRWEAVEKRWEAVEKRWEEVEKRMAEKKRLKETMRRQKLMSVQTISMKRGGGGGGLLSKQCLSQLQTCLEGMTLNS